MARTLLFALLFVAQSISAQTEERTLDIAIGGGEKGPWQQNDSRYDYVDDAAVAFTHDGGQAVAWAEQGGKDVWLRTVTGDGRPGAPVNVSRSPATFSWLPRIAVDHGRNRLYLLWQEIIFSGGSHGADILFARSIDGGRTFSPPLNLSRSRGGDGKGRLDRATWSNGSLDLAVGADGTIIAAWTEYHGALWLSHSRDAGVSFSAPRRIAGDDHQPARGPSLAVGPGRAVHLAWTVGEDPRAALRLASSHDNGASFDAPRLIGDAGGRADAPRLAVDGGGKLHLVYAWHGAAHAEVRYRGGPDFSAPRTLSAKNAAYPMLAGDGRAGLAVAWENLGRNGRPHSLGLAVSRDGGRSFTAPATVPGSAAPPGGSNGSQQGLLGQKLAMDGAGRIAIVNSSLVPGRGSRIRLIRTR